MHERDLELVTEVRNYLGLKNKIYRYRGGALAVKTSTGSKIYYRGFKSVLFVRDLYSLKEIIVPFFVGSPRKQTDPLNTRILQLLSK